MNHQQHLNSRTFFFITFQDITPPDSFYRDSSKVIEVLDLLEKKQHGLVSFSEEWNVLKFSVQQFKKLQARLEA